MRRTIPRSFGVTQWILLLACVPLAGAVWFAAHQFEAVDAQRDEAAQVTEATGELVDFIELQTRLLEERTWYTAIRAVVDYGIDPSLAVALVGVDIEAEASKAQDEVDRALGPIDWPELEAGMTALRLRDSAEEDGDAVSLSDEYNRLGKLVEARVSEVSSRLLASGSDIEDGSELVQAIAVLDAAAIARFNNSLQLTSYFGAQFGSNIVAGTSREELIEQRFAYRQAMVDLERFVAPDSVTHEALLDIERSPEAAGFADAIDEIIADPPVPTMDEGIDVGAILSQIEDTAETFKLVSGSTDVHVALVDAAAADVEASSLAVEAAAASKARSASILIVVVVATSLLFAFGIAQAIGRPLRQLAIGAQRLRDGDTSSPLTPAGPREVRQAMLAINEAEEHIELAQRQTTALAHGELRDPALQETSPGVLGASLHDVVTTLASSLNASEEYRQLLAHEATHDALTGIANRKASMAELDRSLHRARNSHAYLSVMFLDLDGFKEVNDAFGHPAGDTALGVVSDRLVGTIRPGDFVGRLGGDEFLIVAESVNGAAGACALAERISKEISRPIKIGRTTVRVNSSIGIALADAETELTSAEMLHDADLAVYKAKELGGSRIQLCDEELHEELMARSAVERDLRRAIDGDQLTLYYQPIVDTDRRLVSLEALVRWQMPDGTVRSPDEFIPIAERSDLILLVDNWVVTHAVEQMVKWADHELLANVPVHINVSRRHFAVDTFVDDIIGPIRDSGIDPSLVVLEVTESALLRDIHDAAVDLGLLREHGVRIAIDDFGTGYTSLEHLRLLPVDILKIDRSFTADEQAASLVRLVIETGHLLGLTITAEGVETIEQTDRLIELGTDELQGYLFAYPAPADQLQLNGILPALQRSGRQMAPHV